MKKKDSIWEYTDWKAGVWAAVFSCLTLFSVVLCLLPSWYEQLPAMRELVCGQATWTGYAKQADLQLVKWVLIGLPLLFSGFMALFALNRKWTYLDKMETLLLAGSYLGVLLLNAAQKSSGQRYALTWLLVALAYLICRRKGSARKENLQRLGENVLAAFFCYLAVVTAVMVVALWKPGMAALWHKCGDYSMLLPAALLFFFSLLRERAGRWTRIVGAVQIVLPAAFLGMVHFRYIDQAQGEMMELFYSRRWHLFCVAFALVLCGISVWQLLRCKRKLSVSTFIVVAAVRVFAQPDGILNIDFFHNGELSLPMQQLMSHGRLPYTGLIPIHGMCDYFFGAVNTLFFDGSYLSLNAAKIVGNVLMAAFLAVIIYYFVEGHMQGLAVVYLFMPYLIQTAGMRYLFLFVMFLVLFCPRLKGGMWYLYAWVLLSIGATAWNASIGGAAAVAFLPVVLYRCIRFLPGQLKELFGSAQKKKGAKLLAWAGLFALGVSYIPLFCRIVEYLVDNTGTTLFVNGMAIFQEELPQGFGLIAFGFMIPLLFCLYYLFERRGAHAGEYFVCLLCCFYVLINYAFVRFDEGLRSTVMGVFFTLLIMITLLYQRAIKAQSKGSMRGMQTAAGCYLIGLTAALWLTDAQPWMGGGMPDLMGEIPESVEITIRGASVEDPVVYVTGDSVQIPNLGNGFVQGNTLNSLQNVKQVLSQQLGEGQTCLDITNEIANEVIFDRDNFWVYTSAYNISNDRMQKKAVQYLADHLPDMILAAPAIVFDEAPFSFRSPILYQYLMRQGYRAYKYENVIYLLRGENKVAGAVEDEQAFAQLMHREKLGQMPRVWGGAAAFDLSEDEKETQSAQLDTVDIACQVTATQEGFSVRFERPVQGSEVSLLLMQLPAEAVKEAAQERGRDRSAAGADGTEGVLVTASWETDLAQQGSAAYEFYVKDTAHYVIPLGMSPYFGLSTGIEEITFSYPEGTLPIDASKIVCRCAKFRE